MFYRLASVSRVTRVSRSVLRPLYRTRRVAGVRHFATEGPDPRLASLVSRLQEHPEIVQQVGRLQALLISKNLVPKPEDMVDAQGNVRKLTMMQQMNILMDKDVRGEMKKLRDLMDEGGFQLTPEDAKVLMNQFQTMPANEGDDKGNK